MSSAVPFNSLSVSGDAVHLWNTIYLKLVVPLSGVRLSCSRLDEYAESENCSTVTVVALDLTISRYMVSVVTDLANIDVLAYPTLYQAPQTQEQVIRIQYH